MRIRRSCIVVRMDIDILMIVVFAIGVLTLFFFPEPESNFGWYVLIGGLFVLVEVVLFWWKGRD